MEKMSRVVSQKFLFLVKVHGWSKTVGANCFSKLNMEMLFVIQKRKTIVFQDLK